MTTLDVSHMSREALVALVASDQTVNSVILKAAHETPEQEWTVIDVHETVLETLNIDLDLDDTVLFEALCRYFNTLQSIIIKLCA